MTVWVHFPCIGNSYMFLVSVVLIHVYVITIACWMVIFSLKFYVCEHSKATPLLYGVADLLNKWHLTTIFHSQYTSVALLPYMNCWEMGVKVRMLKTKPKLKVTYQFPLQLHPCL